MKDSPATMKAYIAERNRALAELDMTWARIVLQDASSDEVRLAVMHKARYECVNMPLELKRESRAWLERNGYTRFSANLGRRMMMRLKPTCYICHLQAGAIDLRDGEPAELRPYGPRGEYICFHCMKSNSKREAEAKRQFRAQREAAGPIAVIGETTGPRPIKESEMAREFEVDGENVNLEGGSLRDLIEDGDLDIDDEQLEKIISLEVGKSWSNGEDGEDAVTITRKK